MSAAETPSKSSRDAGWYLIAALAGAIVLMVAYHLHGRVPADVPAASIGPIFNFVFKLMRIATVACGVLFGVLPMAFGVLGGLYHLWGGLRTKSAHYSIPGIDKMYAPLALVVTAWTFRWFLFRLTGLGPEGAVGVTPMLTFLSIIANLLGTAINIRLGRSYRGRDLRLADSRVSRQETRSAT